MICNSEIVSSNGWGGEIQRRFHKVIQDKEKNKSVCNWHRRWRFVFETQNLVLKMDHSFCCGGETFDLWSWFFLNLYVTTQSFILSKLNQKFWNIKKLFWVNQGDFLRYWCNCFDLRVSFHCPVVQCEIGNDYESMHHNL